MCVDLLIFSLKLNFLENLAITNAWKLIDLDPKDCLFLDIQEGNMSLSEQTIERLTQKEIELTQELETREQRAKEWLEKISHLWNQLYVSEEEKKSFFDKEYGFSDKTFELCEKEYNRLTCLKSTRLKELILQARRQLFELWEELGYSTEQRKSFGIAFSETFDDETLELHTNEIERLNERAKVVAPIIRLIKKRDEIRKQKEEFENLQKDGSRLLNKGVGAWKEREEESKKRIYFEKNLPKIEEQLVKSLIYFEEKQHESFTWNGLPLLFQLENDSEHEKIQKELTKARRVNFLEKEIVFFLD